MQTKGHSIEQYKEYKNKQSKNPRKKPYNIDNNNVQSEVTGITTQKKQRPLSVINAFSRNSQQVADDLIISFVVETMSPMDIVEHQAFKNLICGNIAFNLIIPYSLMQFTFICLFFDNELI
jgi:hypothetical protein